MEDVLDVYVRPYNPRRPQVCLDETGRQLLGDVTPPLAMAPGRPARQDDEYTREGTCTRFMRTEPWRGWRHVVVSDRRTRLDFAHGIKELVEVHHPDAERVLVMDNRNTHSPASLYATFPPAEAKRLTAKRAIHSTPKHGSWPGALWALAEIEPGVLAGQCLDRRLPDRNTLAREVAAWEQDRNATTTTIHWRFTTADARIKLKHLYPSFEP